MLELVCEASEVSEWKLAKGVQQMDMDNPTGRLEMTKINVKQARAFLDHHEFEVWPGFEKNFLKVQGVIRQCGATLRYDMPVIKKEDVATFMRRLKVGAIDIRAPFSDLTNPRNKYPQFLRGTAAKLFLKRGLASYDYDAKDDIVKANWKRVAVGRQKPIQKQIYFDTAMSEVIPNGLKKSVAFYEGSKNKTISSCNDWILDGHHRWLAAYLIDPSINFNVLKVDLKIKDLRDLMLAYGDALGHPRNR